MSEWICPDCEGGFPRPVKAFDEWCCPWCKAEIRAYDGLEKAEVETLGDRL